MKKYIKFDFFKKGQSLLLTIGKLAQVERLLEKPIGEVLDLRKGLNISATAAILSVAMQHENGVKPPDYYFSEMEKAFENGHELVDIQLAVMKAVISTGILGHTIYANTFPEEAEAHAEEVEKERKN